MACNKSLKSFVWIKYWELDSTIDIHRLLHKTYANVFPLSSPCDKVYAQNINKKLSPIKKVHWLALCSLSQMLHAWHQNTRLIKSPLNKQKSSLLRQKYKNTPNSGKIGNRNMNSLHYQVVPRPFLRHLCPLIKNSFSLIYWTWNFKTRRLKQNPGDPSYPD